MKEEEDFDKVYQKIQNLLSSNSNSISVLEDQIDLEEQKVYFEHSKKVLKMLDKDLVFKEKELLFDNEVDVEKKKDILCVLAKIDSPEAFRAIEEYRNCSDENMDSWATLAFQESKMVLENSLLGKASIFISTGLGGQGNKLRYFLVLVATKDQDFEKWQLDLISNELDFVLSGQQGVVESVEVVSDKVLLTVLLPIVVNIKEVIGRAVRGCNEFGNFLLNSFIITNVKRLELNEIQDIVNEYRLNSNREVDGEVDE